MLNVLRWTVHGGGRAPDPFDVQRHTAFLGRAGAGRDEDRVPQHRASRRRTCGAAGSSAGTRRPRSSSTAAREVEAGERFVYAYYPGVDSIAHEFGLARPRLRARARGRRRDRGRALLDVLPRTRRAARHRRPRSGAPRARVVDRDRPSSAPMTTAMAGDGRFRYLYARKGAARELLAAAREQLGDARVGVVARRAARRGAARRGRDGQRARAASATSCSRRATRSPSSIPRCRTRCSCGRATARSPPTRCSSRSSPPGRPRLTRRRSTRRRDGVWRSRTTCGRVITLM